MLVRHSATQALLQMPNINPTVVLADDVDQLLVLAALFKSLIVPDGLSVYVVDQVTDKRSPVSFSIALHIRYISGNVCGQLYFFPALTRAE